VAGVFAFFSCSLSKEMNAMFQYPESDADGASNLPPASSSNPQPQPERVRHVLYGSLRGLDRAIKILHSRGYADPNDWCEPIPVPIPEADSGREGRQPTPAPNQWMTVMDKILLLE
jgi:hypothetical protein